MPVRDEEAQVAALDQEPGVAGALVQLPPGTVVRVEVGDHHIALVNDRGSVFAFADLCLRCSHALSSGRLAAGALTCGHCGWEYDLMAACVVALPALRIETYGVRIEQEHVFVDVEPWVEVARLC